MWTTPPKRGTAFIRPRVSIPIVKMVSVSGRRRGYCSATITVFVPANTDTYKISLYADKIMKLFTETKIDGFTFEPASLNRRPVQNEWYSVDVTVPFSFTECIN